jgi:hypothetical protein
MSDKDNSGSNTTTWKPGCESGRTFSRHHIKPKQKGANIMAIKLVANYAKRLGLPGYSSHQFSVSIETELHDVGNIAGESAKLYQMLQASVDEQIQQTGFVPPDGYGMSPVAANGANGHHRNGNGNGHAPRRAENGHSGNGNNGHDSWRCSDKQRELIERVVRENHLDKRDVEQLAMEMFSAGVKQLDRLQASGLIDELLERHGGKPRGQKRPYRHEQPQSYPRGGNQ